MSKLCCSIDDDCHGTAAFPSFAKEGWTRPKENVAKHPLKRADGVVVSSYRLFIPNNFDKRWFETTGFLLLRPMGLARCAPPSAPVRNGAIFFMAQPPLLREGGESPRHRCVTNHRFRLTLNQQLCRRPESTG